MNVEALQAQLDKYHQGHLLKYWKNLTEDQKKILIDDLIDLNLAETNFYFTRASELSKSSSKILDDRIKPIDDDSIESLTCCNEDLLKKYEETGLKEIADGHVGVLLMAGGQGTRLGVTYPKGMYDVGLPSHKTLFQLQAERIKRLETIVEEKYGKCLGIIWYILTSEATYQMTNDFLKNHNYFGLKKENIVIFKQAMIPCYDFDGKILLDEMYKISTTPDGNGGVYRALVVSGVLDDMIKRNVKSIHAHSVDNILIKVADPIFIGYCLCKNADCGVKVVEKSEPSEAVGVVSQVDGVYRVVEYSEITKETSELKRPDGKLLFNAGNICNHYFTVDFLNNISNNHEKELDLHIARKKIPFVDDNGVRQVPKIPNGIKIEKFVFDVFKYSKKFVAWNVPRQWEFSPLKNSDSAGQDCPASAKRDVLELHKSWLINSGAKTINGDVEISPLRSYAGENLLNIPDVLQGPKVLE